MIKLASIINHPDVLSTYPLAGDEDKIPVVIYRLYPSIRSKIFNYKETVANIDTNDNVSFGTGIQQCQCRDSIFCDQNHGHIITGNLQIITNAKLRKLLSKGPNFREPTAINWGKCRESIVEGLDECVASMSINADDNALEEWKGLVLTKVDEKITRLRSRIPERQRKQILKDPIVSNYLKELQQNFVLVPIDKASNNIAIICKKYYVEVILKEVGILGQPKDTYVASNKTAEEIIHDDLLYTERMKLKVEKRNESLPSMYWMPKMHKNPTGQRFIIASKFCSTKPLSKSISRVFSLIFTQIENFHTKAKFLSSYNKFWVLKNVTPVTNILNEANRKRNAKSISTFDFSTLYTKIPHTDLVNTLSNLIDFVFEGGKSDCIRISKHGRAYWGSKTTKFTYFSKSSLKQAVLKIVISL